MINLSAAEPATDVTDFPSIPVAPGPVTAGARGMLRFVADHAVIVADVDGVITYWNSGAEELLGYQATDALGRHLDMVIPEHLRQAHWSGFHRAMLHPQVKDLAADLPVLCADGQVRSFPGRLLVLSDGLGVALGAMAIYAPSGTTGRRPFE